MSTPDSLFRLIYASRMSAAAVASPDETLRAILSVAVPANRELDVTGLLVAHQGWFLQALEGSQAVVRGLYERISADPRHRDSLVLVQGRQPERGFGAWTMCARTLSRTDEAVLATLDRKASFDPTMLPERSVIRFLDAVGEVHARLFTAQQGRPDQPLRRSA
jgi:hypothetical protein